MSAFLLDIRPLKEPLGFIRVLEWAFSIFAFASTGHYSGTTSFNIQCQGNASIHETNISFGYPFRLNQIGFDVPTCVVNRTTEMKKHYLVGDHSSSAEFFVAVGVLAFLYCTGILVVYVGYQHVYRESNRGPLIDLLLTGIFTFLWLLASSAWGKGLTDVKWTTSPTKLLSLINACKTPTNKCTAGALPTLGPLNSSVISGFLNLILWAGNCWFIFKETHFHTQAGPSATQQEATRQP
ncbi:synaptophysin-like protein 2b [Ictalurus furcatus]|uniref:synaptophysin-like protein 2b n=1 Tax=Ictalurus furcatus TaxID=66913 RepID=UPI002350F27F|nr:synaptophysin-like protein 2b [Ictalurus furcatus]